MEGNKLFVGNLSFTSSEGELEQLFSSHGSVKSVKIIANKGFGFVEMSSPSEAEAAMGQLNSCVFGGRKINVSAARPMKSRTETTFKRF